MRASDQNAPSTIVKLLRAIAASKDAKATQQDIILNAAADLIEEAYCESQ